MEQCHIRFAEYSDIESIMNFIDMYWKKGHILASDRKLFEWQYIHYNKVTMVLAEDMKGNIQGILGYIPYDNVTNKDIALSLWKANHSESFLGIRLLMFLQKNEPHSNIICTGINMSTTSKIYSSMGMKVNTMKQWYRLHSRDDYSVGVILNKNIPMVKKCNKYILDKSEVNKRIDEFDFEKLQTTPIKSKSYFVNRYLEHPKYLYFLYAVMDINHSVKAWLVVRLQEHCGSKVFRFVDFIGDINILFEITDLIDQEMTKNEAEYIDMYEAGLNDELLIKAGWKEVKNSGNIIPNYFAPFVQNNIDIHYCTSDDNVILFRGDGDQDRPN